MTESKENIKKRIDTNNNQYIENNEIDSFVKDKKNGDIDLNTLGEYLNNLPLYNNDELKKALNNFFRSPERNKYDQTIKNKVTNNQPLDKTELSLMYLAMISEPNKHFTQQQLKFDSNKPVDQICNGALIRFIRTKYNFPTYTGKKVKIDLPNETKKKTNNPIDKIQESKGGNIKLPENIGEIKESEADFYCNRLITRAEQNFPNDIEKAKREIEQKHRYKDEEEKRAYIKRDTLLIAFSKYTEAIGKNNERLIKSSGYKDKEDFENQMKLMEEFGKEIEKKYPNIDEILSKLKKFDEEMKNNEKKYFKNENETKKAERDYKEFNEYVESKTKEYNIKEIEKTLKKDPETKEEAELYLHNINKISAFQEDITQKNKTYGDSITKYKKYVKGAIDIQKKYNVQQYQDILEKYNQDISEWNKKIDFKKYENYRNGMDWKLEVGLKNINKLEGIITDPQNEYFPIKEIKDIERKKQIKQEGIDKFREKIKNFSPDVYRTLTIFTGLRNGLIDATVGAGTSLGVMILGMIGGKNETLAQMDRKEKRDNFLKINQSSSQKESVYDSETGFNFHTDNTVSTVASSISQMLTLIYGGGALAKGATKVFGIGEKVAGKVGLFSSSFITQVGGSYQEAVTSGLTGGEALGYGMLSATLQSGLELVSPNEVLLGKGSGITKELIRNACKSGSKESFKMIGKIFTKNVWNEIREENIQETLQTVAGNLVNMATDGAFGSELGADWSWKNFASTAVITTLTTGITTGTSTGVQMNEMSNQNKAKLLEYIKNDKGIYLEVTSMLDKAIEGKVNIPNINIQQLQELKLSLTGENSGTSVNIEGTNNNQENIETLGRNNNQDDTDTSGRNNMDELVNYEIKTSPEIEQISQILGSRFHEERRQSRLQSDGTYAPRVEKTSDQTWIYQHNGQTEVDIANTSFEELPSDRKSENLEAAKVAVGLVYDRVKNGENITPKMIEKMAEIVHNRRLERNGIEGSFENQRVPYNQLSEEEKEKDRNQVLQAIETVVNGKSKGKIIIPAGKFRAPNEIFAETDESFREIVTKNPEKIRELNEIQDMDEFIRQSFEFIKGKMGVNPNIKLRITDNDNHYDVKENTVYISRNRAGHKLKNINGKGDRAEIFGGLVHELNHYLQRKEFILNFDQDSQYRVGVINYLQEYPRAKENLEYIIANYPDNLELQEAFEKAKTYGENREHYISLEIDENQIVTNYNEYKGQTVEEESFRRGDLAVEEYRRIIGDNDYFGGKSQKIFEGSTENAELNSKFSDRILKEIDEQNKSAKLEELRKEITEQYKQATGEELKLSEEQLLSILDAHEQDGELGKLTIGELRVKVKILSEAITDPKVRRFLLEAGFCGKEGNGNHFENKIPGIDTIVINKENTKNAENIKDTVKREEQQKKTIEAERDNIENNQLKYNDIKIFLKGDEFNNFDKFLSTLGSSSFDILSKRNDVIAKIGNDRLCIQSNGKTYFIQRGKYHTDRPLNIIIVNKEISPEACKTVLEKGKIFEIYDGNITAGGVASHINEIIAQKPGVTDAQEGELKTKTNVKGENLKNVEDFSQLKTENLEGTFTYMMDTKNGKYLEGSTNMQVLYKGELYDNGMLKKGEKVLPNGLVVEKGEYDINGNMIKGEKYIYETRLYDNEGMPTSLGAYKKTIFKGSSNENIIIRGEIDRTGKYKDTEKLSYIIENEYGEISLEGVGNKTFIFHAGMHAKGESPTEREILQAERAAGKAFHELAATIPEGYKISETLSLSGDSFPLFLREYQKDFRTDYIVRATGKMIYLNSRGKNTSLSKIIKDKCVLKDSEIFEAATQVDAQEVADAINDLMKDRGVPLSEGQIITELAQAQVEYCEETGLWRVKIPQIEMIKEHNNGVELTEQLGKCETYEELENILSSNLSTEYHFRDGTLTGQQILDRCRLYRNGKLVAPDEDPRRYFPSEFINPSKWRSSEGIPTWRNTTRKSKIHKLLDS